MSAPGIPPFGFMSAGQIAFGRGTADDAAAHIAKLGQRVLLVRGSSVAFADVLAAQVLAGGATLAEVRGRGEPDIGAVNDAIRIGRDFGADVVVALGGGAVIDLGKAAAALIPGSGTIMDHLEVVGQGQPLGADPLPFVAIPTTSGTGAEVTKNAVINVPQARRKVSLRDPRMVPRLAIIDPALSDDSPRGVTLASGFDAITQVIEPYLSSRANPLSDAICLQAIPMGLRAMSTLAQGEDRAARDAMAFVSLSGGLALANAGLGAVHGLAGVIGGHFAAPHGLICARLLGPVLAANHHAIGGDARFDRVARWIGDAFDLPQAAAFGGLGDVLDQMAMPRLGAWLGEGADLDLIAQEAAAASSMAANPCILPPRTLVDCLRAAI